MCRKVDRVAILEHPPLTDPVCRSSCLLFLICLGKKQEEKQERHEEREGRRREMEFVPKTHWDDYYRDDEI